MNILKSHRVLHVIDTLRIGGAERVLVDICNIQKLNHLNVSVLLLTEDDQMSDQLYREIPIIKLGRRHKFSVLSLFKANAICNSYDIVHVHLRYNFRYIALAKLIFNGRYRLILHDHFGDIENDRSIPLGVGFLLKNNAWFIGVSKPLVEWAVNQIGLDHARCFLLSNIVVKRNIVLNDRASNSNSIRILIVSNFRLSKNHFFAIRLLKILNKALSIRITMVGQVIDNDYMSELHVEMSKYELNDVLTIRHDCNDVQSIIGEFDLAIHTAHQESGPLVLIEYLSQGLPFVAYKTGEVSNQLVNHFPEFFMNNFEILEWCNRITLVLQNRKVYQAKMQSVFDEIYSMNKFSERINAIYSTIISTQ